MKTLARQTKNDITNSPALGALYALTRLGVFTCAVIGAVLIYVFVLPTLKGDAAIYDEGRISNPLLSSHLTRPVEELGVLSEDMGEELLSEAAVAQSTVERMSLHNTGILAVFAFEDSVYRAEMRSYSPDARAIHMHPSIGLKTNVVTRVVLRYLALLVALMALQHFVKSSLSGRPFSVENIQRLRLMGTASVFAWMIDVVSTMIRKQYWQIQEVDRFQFTPYYPINHLWLIVGIAILALGEIFAHGHRLQVSEDLTV